MATEEAERKMQEMASMVHSLVAEMTELAHANRIERFEFLGGMIHFGVDFGQGYDPRWDRPGSVRALRQYVPAHGGPRITGADDDFRWWQQSTFECWPSHEDRVWLFGPDESTWPKTDYEME